MRISSYFKILSMMMLFSGWSCTPVLVKPQLNLEGIELKGVSFSAMDLDFKVRITNPNQVGVRIQSLSYRLDLNKIMLGSGELAQPVDLNASESQIVSLPFSASFNGMSNILKLLLGESEADYELKGKVILSRFFIQKEFSFSSNGSVPIDRSKFHHQ